MFLGTTGGLAFLVPRVPPGAPTLRDCVASPGPGALPTQAHAASLLAASKSCFKHCGRSPHHPRSRRSRLAPFPKGSRYRRRSWVLGSASPGRAHAPSDRVRVSVLSPDPNVVGVFLEEQAPQFLPPGPACLPQHPCFEAQLAHTRSSARHPTGYHSLRISVQVPGNLARDLGGSAPRERPPSPRHTRPGPHWRPVKGRGPQSWRSV